MLRTEIETIIASALVSIDVDNESVTLTHPTDLNHGDYTTNIAMRLANKLKTSPMELAEKIAKAIPKHELIDRVEVLKPGFINVHLSPLQLFKQLKQSSSKDFDLKKYFKTNGKKLIVEFAHPNTHKLFHIGHLLNITVGESLVRILEITGNNVVRVNYQGDVGLHIAKCLWRLQQIKDDDSVKKVFKSKNVTEKIKLIGKAYSEGSKAYEGDEKAKKEIIEVNGQIYNKDPEILPLWEETRNWSLTYFDEIYKRVGSHFDKLFFEHEMADRGLEIIKTAQEKKILKESEGAIIFDGTDYGIDTRVFLNSLGYPTYEGKELALAEKEFSEFGKIDKAIHVVGKEQISFFKITFKVEELLDPATYKDKQYHLAYGWVRLKHGKMSSRSGNVIEGADVLDQVKQSVLTQFKCAPETAEAIAVASVKYSFLKSDIRQDVTFDIEESISTVGNSGPYLLYTFVRASSILRDQTLSDVSGVEVLAPEENQLLRLLVKYPEVVEQAAQRYSPSDIATYLYSIAQAFNLFYQKHPVLKSKEKSRAFRLQLTASTANILQSGLSLLGIQTVEKM